MRGMRAEIQGATSGKGEIYVCFLTLFCLSLCCKRFWFQKS
ncbi:hypothetical protein CSC03_4110 [Enterobacter hormaechei]|nr:hypothetical protein Y59_37270 [Enterobacter hormaechei]PRW23521.1 hypothetical protein CSC03_4110 [Enterobacter hormaechei]